MFSFFKKNSKKNFFDFLKSQVSSGIIDEHTFQFINGCCKLSELKMRDVMVDKSEVSTLVRDALLAESIPTLLADKYSRYPVIEEVGSSNVVGIVLVKDIFDYLLRGNSLENVKVSHFLSSSYRVPESQNLESVLLQMRKGQHHCAIAFDEYNNWSGFLSIEDILEEIVGDIRDEHDSSDEYDITEIDERTHHIFALMKIEDFNRFFGTKFEDVDFKTINGLLVNKFGYIPKKGETIVIDDIEFRVVLASKRRIEELNIVRI